LASSALEIKLSGNSFTTIAKRDFGDSVMETQYLYLNSCMIFSIMPGAFENFKYLQFLNLSLNLIVHLDFSSIFGSIGYLTHLFLDNNAIQEVEHLHHVQNSRLTYITLHNNMMTILPKVDMLALSQSVALKQITLHYNRWLCSCDDVYFKSWLINMSKIVTDSQDVKCINDVIPLIQLPDSYFMCLAPEPAQSHVHKHLATVLGISTTLLCFVLAFIAVLFCYRHTCLILCHNYGLRFIKQKELDVPYDCYVGFDEQCERSCDFVLDVLRPFLTQHNLRVFIPLIEPEFLIGVPMVDNITKHMGRSKRTLIIMSDTYFAAACDWLRFTFRYAHQFMCGEPSHRVMIIAIDDIDINAIDDEDADLKAFLPSRSTIRYGGTRLFWQRLLYFMPNAKPQAVPGDLDEHLPLAPCNEDL